MPAHLKQNSYGVYYLVDGYLNKSLKTKTKREAQARLNQYNEGKYNLLPAPTIGKYYAEWIEKKVPPLVRHSKLGTTSRLLLATSCRGLKTSRYRTSRPKT